MKIRSISMVVVAAGAAASLAACDGLNDALTAHTEVAARAADQELSVTRLSDLLGNSTLQIAVNRDVAMILTDLWMNYHMLAVAAARGDSLGDPKAIDESMRGVVGNIKLRQFMQKVAPTLQRDAASEATYNQAAGDIFVARHILFPIPGGATQEQKDSVRRIALGVRQRITNANFADLAKRHSSDAGTAQQGGNLGAFKRGDMVKPFGDALAALRPGDISQPIESSFGYHIIERPTYANARAQYDTTYVQLSGERAESVYVAKIDQDAKIEVRSNAATVAKQAARDLRDHRDKNDVMASYRGGQLTVGQFVTWIESYPPQMRLPQQMAQAPDSLVRQFVKSIARQEVMLRMADSAGVTISAEERTQLQSEFKQVLNSVWQQLGIDPKSLADSARTVPERQRLAASRVEAYMDRIMAGQAQPLSVPPPVQAVLSKKYESKVFPAGVDRAVERARKLRTTADSARAAQQPRSQVPLPTPPPPGTPQPDPKTKRP